MAGIREEREPWVLVCIGQECGFHLAELRGEEKGGCWVKYHRLHVVLPEF